MKLKKLIAAAVIATSASVAFAQLSADEDLTSAQGNIVVKNAFGECVSVNRNIISPECHDITKTVMETQVVTLGADTFFDFDKDTLKPEGQEAIRQLASEFNQRGASIQKITVSGHTDSIGSEQYNQGLSERRAAAVGNYMLEYGVPVGLIEAYGESFRRPVASNDTAAGRAQNRRVEISIDGLVEVPVEK